MKNKIALVFGKDQPAEKIEEFMKLWQEYDVQLKVVEGGFS